VTASIVSESGTRYLEDLFLHARGCSRRVAAAFEELERLLGQVRQDDGKTQPANLTTKDVIHVIDRSIELQSIVGKLLAEIAPAAVDQLQRLEATAPGFSVDIFNLKPLKVDAVMRPIFEAAGIADDFIPARERFPGNLEEDWADD
jgi:hypothetical protein